MWTLSSQNTTVSIINICALVGPCKWYRQAVFQACVHSGNTILLVIYVWIYLGILSFKRGNMDYSDESYESSTS